MPTTPEAASTSLQFVTRERHAGLCWERPAHYHAAAAQVLAPLASFEAPAAASRMPLAFVEQGGRWLLVAVLGVPSGTNLCVAPDGRWTGPYTPAVFRAAPFALQPAPDGRLLLCVDEAAARVRPADQAAAGAEPFFTPDGAAAPLVRDVLDFLTRLAQGGKTMERACAALHARGLLVPWKVVFQSPSGEPQPVAGLWRVDEAVLRQLPADALHALMQEGAVALAYSQLLSMQHIALLGDWLQARALAATPPAPAAQTPDLDVVRQLFEPGAPDTIQFKW